MIHFDNHRISLLIALLRHRQPSFNREREEEEEEWTSNVWILRFAKDFCGVALWENSHDSDHSRWEKDISQSWRKKDVLHILVHSILLLPHCLLSVRQITLLPPNGHPSFKKMIIKVQGARLSLKATTKLSSLFCPAIIFWMMMRPSITLTKNTQVWMIIN